MKTLIIIFGLWLCCFSCSSQASETITIEKHWFFDKYLVDGKYSDPRAGNSKAHSLIFSNENSRKAYRKYQFYNTANLLVVAATVVAMASADNSIDKGGIAGIALPFVVVLGITSEVHLKKAVDIYNKESSASIKPIFGSDMIAAGFTYQF